MHQVTTIQIEPYTWMGSCTCGKTAVSTTSVNVIALIRKKHTPETRSLIH